jgi:hypothetical protein
MHSLNLMRRALGAVFAVVAMLLAGCAAPTQLNAQWFNPQFAGKPPIGAAGRLLVVSVTPDGTTRRVFEDLMVANLEARGVAAVQSYRFLPADGAATQPQIDAAVKESGAQAVLVSRVLGVSQSLRVAPGAGMWPGWGGPWGGPWGWGWGGYYGGLWGGAYATPQVWTEENVQVETQLFDVATRTVVWSGSSTTTTAPGSQGSAHTLQQFVQLIADTLAAARLI